MIRHGHFQLHTAHVLYLLAVGLDLPPLLHRRITGGHKAAFSIFLPHLNQTHPTGARRMVNIVQFAQGRDKDIVLPSNFKNCLRWRIVQHLSINMRFHGR